MDIYPLKNAKELAHMLVSPVNGSMQRMGTCDRQRKLWLETNQDSKLCMYLLYRIYCYILLYIYIVLYSVMYCYILLYILFYIVTYCIYC